MQILSLHWMIQNISFLMSLRSLKKPNVLRHPVQAKNLHFSPLLSLNAGQKHCRMLQDRFYYTIKNYFLISQLNETVLF